MPPQRKARPIRELTRASTPIMLPVLYRDEHLLIVDKPSGLIVHRGWAKDSVTALALARAQAGCWVYAAHRLDRGTSGILVFGLSSEIARNLQKQFASRTVTKTYLALVRGWCPTDELIDHPLAREKGAEKRSASTRVRCLNRYELPTAEAYPRRYSWVAAHPETGRAHQIRRHLKHINHPLIGDVRYGKGEHNRFFREHLQLHRMVLHASALALHHPVTGNPLQIDCPVPVAIQRVRDKLQAWSES